MKYICENPSGKVWRRNAPASFHEALIVIEREDEVDAGPGKIGHPDLPIAPLPQATHCARVRDLRVAHDEAREEEE
jgi:hypothetical protein